MSAKPPSASKGNDMTESENKLIMSKIKHLEAKNKQQAKRIGKLEKRIAAASTKLSDYFVMFPRDRDKSDELIYQAKAALGKDKDDNAV